MNNKLVNYTIGLLEDYKGQLGIFNEAYNAAIAKGLITPEFTIPNLTELDSIGLNIKMSINYWWHGSEVEKYYDIEIKAPNGSYLSFDGRNRKKQQDQELKDHCIRIILKMLSMNVEQLLRYFLNGESIQSDTLESEVLIAEDLTIGISRPCNGKDPLVLNMRQDNTLIPIDAEGKYKVMFESCYISGKLFRYCLIGPKMQQGGAYFFAIDIYPKDDPMFKYGPAVLSSAFSPNRDPTKEPVAIKITADPKCIPHALSVFSKMEMFSHVEHIVKDVLEMAQEHLDEVNCYIFRQ